MLSEVSARAKLGLLEGVSWRMKCPACLPETKGQPPVSRLTVVWSTASQERGRGRVDPAQHGEPLSDGDQEGLSVSLALVHCPVLATWPSCPLVATTPPLAQHRGPSSALPRVPREATTCVLFL